MNAFALSFGVILLAELGDKSQLMALAFASRYSAWTDRPPASDGVKQTHPVGMTTSFGPTVTP